MTRKTVGGRTGGELPVSLQLLQALSVLQFALLNQHLPPDKSCVERSHLLLIIEDADTEKTQRDEATDEDNDEDDGVLLAVQIWSGKGNKLFLLTLFAAIISILSKTFLCIRLNNPADCWVPC